MRETQMLRQTKSVLLAVAMVTALSACESPAVSDDDRGDRLSQQDWVADSINGAAVINPGRVTLSFAEGRVSGRAGCNLYSGPVEVGNGTLKIGSLISTKMACLEEGLMAQESTYLNALQGARSYSFAGDGKLTISTASGALVYSGAPRQQRPDG
jgi:heat shock protein HslJ